MEDTEAMMAKVRKLLALADSTKTTEGEATAAALKIQELVQSYGLDLAAIEAANPDTLHGVREVGTVNRRAMFEWQQDLMRVLAENNFCHYDVRTIYVERKNRNSKQHFLVGRKLNIDIACQVYDYLISTMKRLCERQDYQHHATRTLFYEGASKRLVERLRDQRNAREMAERYEREQARRRGEQTNALVLADVYGTEADLNNDALNGYPIGTTANRRKAKEDKEAQRVLRQKEFEAKGIDTVVAFYMSHGYDQVKAADAANAYHQAVRRQARRAHRHRGFTMGDHREQRRSRTTAYKAGLRAGDEIGLDDQVGHQKPKGYLK